MAFYLHRAFGARSDLRVVNDLRIVDPDQPEHDGRPGVCQIDHLVVHSWGMVIVESKSACGEVRILSDSAGEQWMRGFKGRWRGMQSPFQQARLQGELLRGFLQRRAADLLARHAFGLRTVAKVLSGSDQRGFRRMPIQIVVAYADTAIITPPKNWSLPGKPFENIVVKADAAPDWISNQVERHRKAAGLTGRLDEEYGLWAMSSEEVDRVVAFLVNAHSPREAPVDRRPIDASVGKATTATRSSRATPHAGQGAICKACGGASLEARWGKYGYYWRCAACEANTPMPTICSVCGAAGAKGKVVRIRKEGSRHFRVCEACGIEECIWQE